MGHSQKNPQQTNKQTDSDNLKVGGRVEARLSACRACRVTATSRSLSLHADKNTSAPLDTRSHHPLLSFASVSHSPSVISKGFRSSVKQLHHDFSGRLRRCLLLPLTRLPCRKALGRRWSCWRSRKPANRSRRCRMVVSTLSHPVMARVAAYDNGWSEHWRFRKPTHRRRSRWFWVRRRPYSRDSSVQVLHPYSMASLTSASSNSDL